VAVSIDSAAAAPLRVPALAQTSGDPALTKIIAIAGASGSGKTYLSTYVAQHLDAPVLSLDAYYLDLSHLSPAEREQWNFDDPASLDWVLLRSQLAALREGHGVDVPVYDFATHSRTEHVRRIEARGFLVLEGIFALYDAAVRAMLSLGVFIDFHDPGCLARRTARDVAERGRTPSSVREQYARTVRPMYLKYIVPTRQYAQVVVKGDSPPERSLEALYAHLPVNRG
jgi:uridine kinase